MIAIFSSSIPPPPLAEVFNTFFSSRNRILTASQSCRHTPKILCVSAL
jgi:hypothetical protein